MKTATLYFLLALSAGLAQNTKDPPARLLRVPPPTDPLQKRVADDLKELQPTGPPATAPARLPPKPDLPLTPTAKAAVKVSEKWLTGTVAPATGPDGRVIFVFGAGLPTLVCAPLRICLIELQAGEHLAGEPHIGDSVRWNIAPATFGKTQDSTTVIVIKPQESGLDTNLLVTTDRRAYYIRLVSKPEDYTARIAFSYPDDELAEKKWQEHLAKEERERNNAGRLESLSGPNLESVNFDYALSGGSAATRPVQVLDDGVKTYIRMPPEVQNREAPVLISVGADGKPEMLNYRVKGTLYIVDRIMDHARLVTGSGKKAQKVEIIRGTHKP
jgi:type IV secretion system protein VirB9